MTVTVLNGSIGCVSSVACPETPPVITGAPASTDVEAVVVAVPSETATDMVVMVKPDAL